MRDTQFYEQVLGLEKPWRVSRVELDATGRQVDVWVGHPDGVTWLCPQCGADSVEFCAGITPRSGHGVIWTHASSRPICTRVSLAWTVPTTAW